MFGMTDAEFDEFMSLTLKQANRYQQMRWDGESHKMALMLASRKFPGVVTDSVFNEGRCNGNQFEATPAQGDYYKRIADQAGVSVTGKFYASGLAEFPGDPRAWIDGRGDVARIAEANGMNVTGAVSHRSGERPPLADVAIDTDLVRDEALDVIDSNPGLKYDDVYGRLHDLRTGRVDPNPPLVQEAA